MSFSYHLRFRRGTLKIKSENQLRGRERGREVPVWCLGGAYFVWIRRETGRTAGAENVGGRRFASEERSPLLKNGKLGLLRLRRKRRQV